MTSWNDLGTAGFDAVAEARLSIHHAAQLAAIGVAKPLLPSRDDDSHTTLVWQSEADQWTTTSVPGTGGLRAGLRPGDLELTLGPSDDPARYHLALAGRTRDEAIAWLRRTAAEDSPGLDTARIALDFHYEMPPHPVADGARFAPAGEAHREVAAWFAAADDALRAVLDEAASPDDDPSPIRTWPHHFDIATLLTVAPGRTIGVGMTPGDSTYSAPYWYVGPYPRPETDDLPPLPRGHWHTDGFFAAVLDGPSTVAITPSARRAEVVAFLVAAIDGCRQLLA